MARKPVEVVEETQRIEENLFLENYSFIPEFVRRFFINNIITRTLSHLVAWSATGAKRLVCTTAGILKVAPVGTGFEYNDTRTDNAPDTYGTAIQFDSPASRVDVFTYDYACYIQRSHDGSTWQDEIELPADFFYSFDGVTPYLRIKNKTGAQVCRYVILGWY